MLFRMLGVVKTIQCTHLMNVNDCKADSIAMFVEIVDENNRKKGLGFPELNNEQNEFIAIFQSETYGIEYFSTHSSLHWNSFC